MNSNRNGDGAIELASSSNWDAVIRKTAEINCDAMNRNRNGDGAIQTACSLNRDAVIRNREGERLKQRAVLPPTKNELSPVQPMQLVCYEGRGLRHIHKHSLLNVRKELSNGPTDR